MQELEKILEEIEQRVNYYKEHATLEYVDICAGLREAEGIIRKHMNDGWIPVDEKPKKDYETVFAVDKNDYYFVAVYDKYHGFRSNDIGADVDNIVAYSLFKPYRPERRDSNDGE